jgi:hypothetical protein
MARTFKIVVYTRTADSSLSTHEAELAFFDKLAKKTGGKFTGGMKLSYASLVYPTKREGEAAMLTIAETYGAACVATEAEFMERNRQATFNRMATAKGKAEAIEWATKVYGAAWAAKQ